MIHNNCIKQTKLTGHSNSTKKKASYTIQHNRGKCVQMKSFLLMQLYSEDFFLQDRNQARMINLELDFVERQMEAR